MASTIQQIETPKCARALDTSGNNNHGQIYSGRALEFDGVTDYFQHNGGTGITGTSLFANGVPWTWACWIYFDSASTSENYFVGNDGQTQPHITFKNSSSDNILRFRDTNADYYTFSTTKLDNNTWYRIVITTDGTSITAYVNGVVYGTIAANQANVAADDNFDNTLMEFSGWGCPYSSGGTRAQHLQGMMSDGQVWDATWTASDVSYDYLNPESLVLSNGGTSLAESNLKIWYPMQDGHRGQQSYILDASNAGLGDELVTNGTFDSDISSWTDYASSYTTETYDNGGLKIVASGGTARMTQEVTGLKSGTTYKFSFDVVSRTGNNFAHLGTAAGGSQIASNLGYATAGTHTHFFTSTQTTVHIQLGTVDGTTVVYDNVSLKPVNDKNNATTVFYGDEFITNDPADNRTFDNDAGNWVAHNSTIAWNASYGASGGGLRVTCNGGGGSSEGTKLTSGNWGSSIVLGRTYLISADIKGHTGELDDFRFTFGNVNTSTFSVTTSFATYTATITPNSLFIIKTNSNTDTNPFYIDNISVKEVGVASGWTDADQQLHIPQTVLQSYNELAWFQDKLGNDNPHAEVAHHADFDPVQGDLTVSCWVFQNDAHDDNYVFQKGGGGTSGWHIRVTPARGLQFTVEDDAGVTVTTTSADNIMPLGEWAHIVGVLDYGSTAKVYLNGEEVLSNDISSVTGNIELTSTGNAKLRMGSWTTSYAGGVMNGCATEWSIFKGVAFSVAEVNELYNDGKALDVTTHSQVANLKGYWRNDGSTVWKNIHNPGTHDATFLNGAETILIPQGLDNRDSQGFLMNKQRNTSSLNLTASTDDYVDIPVEKQGSDTLAFLGVGNGFSISCWVKMNNTLNAAEWIINRNDATDGYRLGIDANEKINFSIEENGNLKTAITDSAITVGTWYHVVGTFNGDPTDDTNGDILLYINGVTGSSTTDNITNDSNDMDASANVPLTIGLGHTLYANLEIDGVLMYNDVLTQAEVTRNYNATKGSHRN